MVGIDEGRANFTYHAPPVISSTFPFSGPVADSTAIVIHGANLGLGTHPTCRLVQGGTTQDRPSERLPASAVAPAPASASGDPGPGSEDDYGDAGSGSGGDDEGSGDYGSGSGDEGSGSGDEDSWNNLTLGRARASLNCTVGTSWAEGEVRAMLLYPYFYPPTPTLTPTLTPTPTPAPTPTPKPTPTPTPYPYP